MKKLLLAGLPVLIIFMGLPFLVTLMVTDTVRSSSTLKAAASPSTSVAS